MSDLIKEAFNNDGEVGYIDGDSQDFSGHGFSDKDKIFCMEAILKQAWPMEDSLKKLLKILAVMILDAKMNLSMSDEELDSLESAYNECVQAVANMAQCYDVA